MRRAAKVDANQEEIVKALRRCGVAVEIIGKPVDLLICHRGVTALAEVKNEDGRGDRLTQEQIEFIARWPGKIHIWKSAEQAVLEVVGG